MDRQTLEQMNERARAHLRYARAEKKRRELEEEARQPARRSPITSTGIRYTDEGIETHPTAAEEIDIPAALPAKDVAFSVRPARYRLELRLERPAAIDVFRSGQEIVQSRRVHDTAVLDIGGGQFRIESSAVILDMRLHRFGQRAAGELVLGPFEAEGIVEAEAKGHGNWEAQVASDRVYDATLDTAGTVPDLTLHGDVWEGAPRGSKLPESKTEPIDGGWPWSVVRRFESGLEAPNWSSAVKAGAVFSGHEEVTEDGVIELDHSNYRYWRGVGEWTMLAGENAPSFDPTPGRWAYVWGAAENADRAYSLKTGRQTDPTTEGVYLVKSGGSESTQISGARAAQGSPVSSGRETLAPGSRWRAEKGEHPSGILVKLEGAGLAKSVELRVIQKKGPKGKEVQSTRRIDLSNLWDPRRKDVPSGGNSGGRGIFLSHSERSP